MMALFSHPGIIATLLGGVMGLLMAVFGCDRAQGRESRYRIPGYDSLVDGGQGAAY
ncbi:MAG: hypothetical protein ACR5LG_14595 [Sodalis sp. (in: enterobacteria)]|uniref:hypothetical protein n=1 Tax=Sodalis sp. (in: enterobacteria) TaxID=1898979 RepID=UPI003F365F14